MGVIASPGRITAATLSLAAVLIFAAPRARAQEVTIDLDPARTTISISLGATLHTVHGAFKMKSGEIQWDAATGKASGSIAVDATSGNTENDSRDKKMHGDVLESAKFPEIVFVASSVKGDAKQILSGTSQSHAELSGTLHLHGADHPVTMAVTIDRSRGEPVATASFSVPYVDWGLKDPSTAFLRVKKTVDVEIETRPRIVGSTR